MENINKFLLPKRTATVTDSERPTKVDRFSLSFGLEEARAGWGLDQVDKYVN